MPFIDRLRHSSLNVGKLSTLIRSFSYGQANATHGRIRPTPPYQTPPSLGVGVGHEQFIFTKNIPKKNYEFLKNRIL